MLNVVLNVISFIQKLSQKTVDSNMEPQLEIRPCLLQEITFLQIFLNSHGVQA